MITGVVFDKDGTLFDFNATWGAWTQDMLRGEAGGDAAVLQALADVLGYDLAARQFRPGSIVIAETSGVVADAILGVTGGDRQALLDRMNLAAQQVVQIETVPLAAFMQGLREQGLRLGLATNDSEVPARRHLDRAGILHLFDFIAGYDSGHGGKPAAGQLTAFCRQTGLAAESCVMVGDSTHDLHAGRLAGMRTVGVLTGPAPASELAPLADAVLPSIADLPGWIAAQRP